MLYSKPMKKHELRDNLELNDIINEILLNSKPVKYYKSDISYDIINIVHIDDTEDYKELIWIVREHGTWLIDTKDTDLYNSIYQTDEDIKAEYSIKYNQNEQRRWSIERTK